MNSIKKMNLFSIIIPTYYSKPNVKKMNNCREFYKEHGVIDRDIVVNEFGVMVDGYIGYLVLKENGITEYDVISVADGDKSYLPNYREMQTTYVFAHHLSGSKEFCWRMTKKTMGADNLKIGSYIVVNTVHGNRLAKVTRIETLDKPPIDRNVRKVIKCLVN